MLGLNAPVGAPFRVPLTSYANPGGSGDRTGSITVTCSANIAGMIAGGTLSNLVNGGFNPDSTDSIDFVSAGFVNGDWFTFDFGVGNRKYLDELTTWFDRDIAWGDWLARASVDNATWYELNTFNWVGSVSGTTQVITGMSSQGCRYFSLLKVGPTNGTVPRFKEIGFKIADR